MPESDLLQGFAVSGVADEELEIFDVIEPVSEGGEAGQEEVTDGETGSVGGTEDGADLVDEGGSAVVDDVVGHGEVPEIPYLDRDVAARLKASALILYRLATRASISSSQSLQSLPSEARHFFTSDAIPSRSANGSGQRRATFVRRRRPPGGG